jgi:hypothetical protein
MEVTIEEAIQHIKNSCYIVGYPTHDRQNETRKRINASLDMAIDIMRKYQKIQEIVEHWACCGNPSDSMIAISEVLENGSNNQHN